MNDKRLTDGQAVNIARKIDRLNSKILDLMDELRAHGNGDLMFESLQDNYFNNPALATHCIKDDLHHPERWAMDYYKGVTYRSGKNANLEDRLLGWYRRQWEEFDVTTELPEETVMHVCDNCGAPDGHHEFGCSVAMRDEFD